MVEVKPHSPGPWRVDPIPPSAHTDPDIAIDKDAVFWIAEDRVNGEVLALVTVVGNANPGDVAANGRVMAAAPELLDACKAGLNSRDLGSAFDMMREAIAKAEGR